MNQSENLYTPDCIRTYTGLYMNVFAPTTEMICIEDIAHSLSNQCRFAGHLPYFYSVAQHSVACSRRLLSHKLLALQALFHDASEAYLMDIPSPIKKRLSSYIALENNLMKLIARKFEFDYPLYDRVKEIDELELEFEWNYIMLRTPTSLKIEYWDPELAKAQFISQYHYITTILS